MNKLIKTAKEHAAAIERLGFLMEANPARGTPESDELELTAHLIEVYESAKYPIGMPDPVEAIQFRMEQQGLTRNDLVPMVGSLSKVSEVLSGKRGLSLAMIRRLHDGLNIPTDVLLQTAPLRTKAERSTKTTVGTRK